MVQEMTTKPSYEQVANGCSIEASEGVRRFCHHWSIGSPANEGIIKKKVIIIIGNYFL